MTTKKEEDKPVNSRRKKKSEPKRLLIELIQSSKVKPTITESEFKKIIGE